MSADAGQGLRNARVWRVSILRNMIDTPCQPDQFAAECRTLVWGEQRVECLSVSGTLGTYGIGMKPVKRPLTTAGGR